jgi:hypothetical protein
MENFEDKKVYHGSPQEFDSENAIPKKNIRRRWNKETESYDTIFDQDSFHATSEKWIALAYTYNGKKPFEIDGRNAHYNMGVSLYTNNRTICIFGFNSLEESLKVLYGEGGYVYHFDKDKFLYKEGLGNLEVIIEEPVKPISVEKIDDPVSEMRKLGIKFYFADLGLKENEDKRNYF